MPEIGQNDGDTYRRANLNASDDTMSDERDPTTLPRWEELLRRLDQTHRRLETAHAEYLEAAAASQRALERVIGSFGEIAEAVRELVPEPIGAEGDDEAIVVASEEASADGQATPDREQIQEETRPPSTAPVEEPTVEGDEHSPPDSATDDGDHEQNSLPARLHSRGVALPEDFSPAPMVKTSSLPARRPAPSGPARGPYGDVHIDRPTLAERPIADEGSPFSVLDRKSRIVITNDGFGVAAALSERLSQAGYPVRVEGRRPDLSSRTDVVIFLGGLRAPSNLDDAMSIVEDAIDTARRMTTRLMQPGSGFIAAIDTAGGFGLSNFDPVSAPLGSLLGLVRLLDRRHPGARARLIDIDGGRSSAHQIAELLATEILSGGDDSPIALVGEKRLGVEWSPFTERPSPADWLEDDTPPLVYMPGPDAVLTTAVERLAIAHELPVALLGRRQAPPRLPQHFKKLGIQVHAAEYQLDRLFSVMDFLDGIRDRYGPIAAIVAESFPVQNPDDLERWDVIRPPLDEFNALLAMTINDPLRLLGVGLGPKTPPVVASALRYFARAESLRRNEYLQVRLAHLERAPRRNASRIDPHDFALTEFLSGGEPTLAEVRIGGKKRSS